MANFLFNEASVGDGSKSSAPGLQRNSDVPDKAYDVLETVKKQNGAPPKNYKGGEKFKNRDKELPEGGQYREYDVNPYVKGVNRGTERPFEPDAATARHFF